MRMDILVNTKQAAFLALIGTALALLAPMIPLIAVSFQASSTVLGIVWYLFWLALLGAALPMFFFLLSRSAPLLLIPAGARRAALAAAIGTGLQGGLTTYSFVHSLPVVWTRAQTFTFLELWQTIVRPSISVVPAVVVPLFFVIVYRRPSGKQPVPGMVKQAAEYTAASCLLGVVMTIYAREVTMRQHALVSQMNLGSAVSLLSQLSMAAFFVVWCMWAPSD